MRLRPWQLALTALVLLALFVSTASPIVLAPKTAHALTPEQTKLVTRMDSLLNVLSDQAQFISNADTANTGVGALSSSLIAANEHRAQLLAAIADTKAFLSKDLQDFLSLYATRKRALEDLSMPWIKVWRDTARVDPIWVEKTLLDPDYLVQIMRLSEDESSAVLHAVEFFRDKGLLTTTGRGTYYQFGDDVAGVIQKHSRALRDFFANHADDLARLQESYAGRPAAELAGTFRELALNAGFMEEEAAKMVEVTAKAHQVSARAVAQGAHPLGEAANKLDEIAKWGGGVADDLADVMKVERAQVEALEHELDVVNRWASRVQSGGPSLTTAQRVGLFMTALTGLAGTVKAVQEYRAGDTDEACNTARNTIGTVSVDLLLFKLGQVGSATVSAAAGWAVVAVLVGDQVATYVVEAPVRDLDYMDGLLNTMYSGKPETLARYLYPEGTYELAPPDLTARTGIEWVLSRYGHDDYASNYVNNPSAYGVTFPKLLDAEWQAWKDAARRQGQPEPTMLEVVNKLIGAGTFGAPEPPLLQETYDLPIDYLKLVAHVTEKANVGPAKAPRAPWAMLAAREKGELRRLQAQFQQMRDLINQAAAAEGQGQLLAAQAVNSTVICTKRLSAGANRRNDTPDDNLDISSANLRSGQYSLYDDFVLGILRKPEKLALLYEMSVFHKAYTETADKAGLPDPDEVLHPESLYLLRKQLQLTASGAEAVAAALASQPSANVEKATFNLAFDETVTDLDGKERRLTGSYALPFYPISTYAQSPSLLRHDLEVELDYLDELWGVPEVALLRGGEYGPLMDFLLAHHVPVALVDSQTTMEELGNFKLFLVPSGALTGADTPSFRRALDGFTRAGGTVVSFTQQYGSDFQSLPGAEELSAYGWSEDQACQFRSSSINAYIPAFASQTKAAPDFNVDGYFLAWPQDAQVLLRRTANDQPAMLLYGHGLGRVVLSSLYSDWAYSHHQMTADEEALLLDLVAWGKAPGAFSAGADKAPGQPVSVMLPIANNASVEVKTVGVDLISNEGTIVASQNVSTSIAAGAGQDLPVTVTLPAGRYGTYALDYTAKGADGKPLFNQVDVARLVASKFNQDPSGLAYKGQEITFSVQSDRETYALNGQAHFTVVVFNNGVSPRQVKLAYRFPHNSWVAGNKPPYVGESVLTVPAKSKASHDISIVVVNRDGIDRLWADFYDAATGQSLGGTSKGFYTLAPSLGVRVTTDKPSYRSGETLFAQVSVDNPQASVYSVSGTLSVIDPSGARVLQKSFSGDVGGEGALPITSQFLLPGAAYSGEYEVVAVAEVGADRLGGASTSFSYEAGNGVLSGHVLSVGGKGGVAGASAKFYMGEKTYSATADALGAYSLELPSGRYRVELSAEGYYRTTGTVGVGPGRNPSQDFFVVSKTAAAAAGSAGTLSGRVLALQTDRPVTGVAVVLKGAFGELAAPAEADGRFSFPLPPGDYTLGVRRETTALLENVPVSVAVGQTVVQDLYVPDATSGVLSGKVLGLTTNLGLAGATLVVEGQKATTAGDGSFTLSGVAGGLRQVQISAEGYAPQTAPIYFSAQEVRDFIIYMTPVAPVPHTMEVRDLQSDAPVPGASVTAANAVLAGGEQPANEVGVDNRVQVYVNDKLVHDLFATGYAGTLPLSLKPGDRLRVVASDYGGSKGLSALWLHNLSTGEKQKLSGGVPAQGSGYNHTAVSPMSVFFDETYTVPAGWKLPSAATATAGADGKAVISLPPRDSLYPLLVSADGYSTSIRNMQAAPGRPVSPVVYLERRWLRSEVTVRAYDTDEPLAGATVAIPNVMLSGEDPNAGIFADNRLQVFVNGKIVHDLWAWSPGKVGPLYLTVKPGDQLRLAATDMGDNKALSAVWMHNLYTAAKVKLTDGVPQQASGYTHTVTSPERVIVDVTYTVPPDARLTSSPLQPLASGADGKALVEAYAGQLGLRFPLFVWAPGYAAGCAGLVSSGAQPSPTTVYLERSRVTLSGVVRDLTTNGPIAGASVSIGGNSELGSVNATTDAGGVFTAEVAVKPAMPRVVQVSRPGYGLLTSYVMVSSRSASDALKKQGNFVELYLEKASKAVSGRVLDLATGAPKPGATLSFDNGQVTAVTDGLGAYTATLTNGFHALTVSASGYASLDMGMYVSQRSSGQDIYLKSTSFTPPSNQGTVLFKVYDAATGQPLEGASVFHPVAGFKYTSAQGEATHTVPAGPSRLYVSKDGYEPLDFTPWMAAYAGKTTALSIYLRSARTPVTVRVYDAATGLPIGGASVFTPILGYRTTDATGAAVHALAGGDTRLYIAKDGYEPQDFNPWGTVFPGRPTELPIYLRSSKTPLTVQVHDLATGNAVDGASTFTPYVGYKTADAQGAAVQVLQGGVTRLLVSKDGYESIDLDPWPTIFPGRPAVLQVYLRSANTPLTIKAHDASTGQPVEGASVFTPARGYKSTDSTGAAVHTLQAGGTRLLVSKDGYESLDFNAWGMVYPGRPTEMPVYLRSSKTPVVIRVLDEATGQPLQGASTFTPILGYINTDARGEAIHRLPAGGTRLLVTKDGYNALDFDPWPTAYPGRPTTVTVYLRPRGVPDGTLAVKVVDGATARPLTGAVLKLDGKALALAADGSYSGNTQPGAHVLVAEASGYDAVQSSLYVFSGKTTRRELRVFQAAAAAGQAGLTVLVRDAASLAPLGGAAISLSTAAGKLVQSGRTDAKGTFKYNLVAGEYGLDVSLDNYVAYSTALRATGGKSLVQDVALESLTRQVARTPADYEVTPMKGAGGYAFKAGEDTSLGLEVKNVGGSFGQTDVRLDVPGVFQGARSVFLQPGDVAQVSFQFKVPADLDTRSDRLAFTAGSRRVEAPFTIEGARISVAASLDKEAYAEGEKARLTLNVKNNGTAKQDLEARVQLGSFIAAEPFSLDPAAQKTFSIDVPVAFNGDKLLFGVYQTSGRSMYLNAYYLRKAERAISISTDKQQYAVGDTATITLDAREAGKLTLSPPKGWEALAKTVSLGAGKQTVTFSVPQELTGTHLVRWTFVSGAGTAEGALPVDVQGYQLKVKQVSTNKPTYGSQDILELSVDVEASRAMTVVMRAQATGPDGGSVGQTSETWNVVQGLNEATIRVPIDTPAPGTHDVVVSLQVDLPGHSLVTAGEAVESFDVVDNAPPEVTQTSPAASGPGIPTTRTVSIAFSEAMDRASVEAAFQMMPAVKGVFSWSGNTVTFVPSTELSKNTNYAVTIAAGARDASGNAMPAYTFKFTTGATGEPRPAIPQGGIAATPTLTPAATPGRTPTVTPGATPAATPAAPTPTSTVQPHGGEGRGGGGFPIIVVAVVIGVLAVGGLGVGLVAFRRPRKT